LIYKVLRNFMRNVSDVRVVLYLCESPAFPIRALQRVVYRVILVMCNVLCIQDVHTVPCT
jgi:hypothetical protein